MNTITKYCHNKFLANSEEIENTDSFDYLLKAIWALSEKNEEGAYSLTRTNISKVTSKNFNRANYIVFQSYGCWNHILSDYLYRNIKQRFAKEDNPPQLYKDVQYRFRINSTLEGLNSFVCPQLLLDKIFIGETSLVEAKEYTVNAVDNGSSKTELYNPNNKNLPNFFNYLINKETLFYFEESYYSSGDKIKIKKGKNTILLYPKDMNSLYYQNLLTLLPLNIKEITIYGY